MGSLTNILALAYKSLWLPMQVLNVFSVYFAQKGTYHSILINSNNAKAWLLSYRMQVVSSLQLLFLYFTTFWWL
jgi:hypothetical protein